MNRIFLLAGSALMALTMACCASAAEQTLEQKHGGAWPKNTTGFAIKGECMKCHGDYKALAKATSDYVPNPHYSHMGEVNCIECHKPAEAADAPQPMCNSCHKFKFEKKAAGK